MSPENTGTQKLMGFYMEVLILGVIPSTYGFCSGRNVMRGRVVHRLTNCAHRHGRIRVRVKIPSGRCDYLPMGGLNWNITSSLMYS